MLGKTPNKVYDPFLKAGLGYKNLERLKKAIAAQPKMYNGEKLHSSRLIIDSPDSEETLEDAEENFSVEQTYFSIPSTSNNGSESKEVTSDLPIPKMPKESKLLKMFDTLEFYKTDCNPMFASKNLKELKEELIEEKNEMLKDELEKSLSDSKDIQANLLKRIKIFENDFKRSQAQKRENIKLEYQKLFNSIKATWTQHQKVLDELIEHANQKTYAYADVRAQNQDLLLTISELKNKLRIVDKGKNVNTNRSKPVTSHPTPKNEQRRTQNKNVLARGMYRITKTETQTSDSKTNITVSNSTGVESSNSVSSPKSKDIKSKNRVLKNTNAKSSTAHVRKMSRSASIDSNKRETKNSNVCQSNTSVLSTKTVNVVNDVSNIVCVSCGKDVFLLSHEKCVARYALSRSSSVKRALFTNLIASKSKNLGATSVVVKSRLSVAKTPTATNRISSVLPLSLDSSQSRTLSNYMKNKIATSRKWQKWFEYQQSFNWTPKNKTAQSIPSETKSCIRVRSTSNTLVTTQKLVAKLSTLPSAFVSCDAGTIRFGNDHFAAITGYEDYVQGNLTICHVYYVEGLGHNLFSVG
ncbi:hypothetical protein Tco_0437839 [Tanacetum coccineum]